MNVSNDVEPGTTFSRRVNTACWGLPCCALQGLQNPSDGTEEGPRVRRHNNDDGGDNGDRTQRRRDGGGDGGGDSGGLPRRAESRRGSRTGDDQRSPQHRSSRRSEPRSPVSEADPDQGQRPRSARDGYESQDEGANRDGRSDSRRNDSKQPQRQRSRRSQRSQSYQSDFGAVARMPSNLRRTNQPGTPAPSRGQVERYDQTEEIELQTVRTETHYVPGPEDLPMSLPRVSGQQDRIRRTNTGGRGFESDNVDDLRPRPS